MSAAPAASESKSTFPRVGILQLIIENTVNGDKGAEKERLTQLIDGTFNKSNASSDIRARLGAAEYDSKTLRVIRSGIKSAEAALKDLDSSENTNTTLDALTKKYEIVVPTGSDPTAYVKEQINAKLADLNSKLTVCNAKQEERNTLTKESSKLEQQFNKELKIRYSTWKKEQSAIYDSERKAAKAAKTESANEQSLFDFLISKLPNVSDASDRAVFDLMIQRDRVNHESVRPSKTKLILRHLVTLATPEYMKIAADGFHKETFETASANFNLAEKKALPSQVDVRHFIGANPSFSSALDALLYNSNFTELAAAETNEATAKRLIDMADLPDYKPFSSWVESQVHDTKFSKNAIKVVAGLLICYSVNFAKFLSVSLENRYPLQTVNSSMIHSSLLPFYIVRGEDYSEMRATIEKIWETTKKVPASPSP